MKNTPTPTAPIEAELISRRMKPAIWSPKPLEEVRDKVIELRNKVIPMDLERPTKHFRFLMPNGRPPSLQLLDSEEHKEPMALTKGALSQLASDILVGGKRFYEGLFALSQMSDPNVRPGLHRDLAEGVINEFLRDSAKPRLFRTFQQLPGHGPVIRAVLSQTYTPIDDLDLIQALLNNKDTRNLPVLSIRSTDAGTRIRLALNESFQGDCPRMHEPIELLEVWNSEVGRRGVWAILGLWKLICLNGLTGFSSKLRYMWRHSGHRQRILSGVKEFIKSSRTEVSGALDAYNKAAVLRIEDALGFIEALGGSQIPSNHRLSKAQVGRVKTSLASPTTSKTKEGESSLASIVDAITLASQEEKDLFEAERMEHSSGYVLQKGLKASSRKGGALKVSKEKQGKAIIEW